MNQYKELFAGHYAELDRLRRVEREYAEFHGKTIELLLHIEDIVDEFNWDYIDPEKWNAVSMTTLNKQE